jgi:mxaK protein
MIRGLNIKNILLLAMVIIGLVGVIVEGSQYLSKTGVNKTLTAGKILKNKDYPFYEKFSAAYFQGNNKDYKHAVQTYTQLIDSKSKVTIPSKEAKASIQYNIANNLLLKGLSRKLNEDGSLKDESKFSFLQARVGYEQSLRLNPNARNAKFNLSLLNAIMPSNMRSKPKEKSGVELSNTPIGLP